MTDLKKVLERFTNLLPQITNILGFEERQTVYTVEAVVRQITEDAHQFRPVEDGDGECAICHMGIGHSLHAT